MWELARGTFSGRPLGPRSTPSLWSNRRGRLLMGDLGKRSRSYISANRDSLRNVSIDIRNLKVKHSKHVI